MTAALPRYRVRFLHLTAVWAYGVTQPVLAIVDGNPDLVLLRGASRLDLVVFALVVAIAVPALIVTYCWVVGRLSRWAADVLFLVALGTALTPLAARAVKRLDPGFVVALVAIALLAVAGVVLYARSRALRLFVGYSIVLPLAAAAAFVYGLPTLTEDAEAAPAGIEVGAPKPVVVIVLDELPVSSLMTRDGRIDAVRYPGFARLAHESTWYPNATTVREFTADAVPAILTGQVGEVRSLPIFRNHPGNLFSLLGDSYRLFVHESWTKLCPERNCPRERDPHAEIVHTMGRDAARLYIPRFLPQSLSTRLMQVDEDLSLGDQPGVSTERCESSLDEAAASSSRPPLLYCHVLLPHAPWMYLPSGAHYDDTSLDGWSPTEVWEDDEWLVLQGFQRHLLQLAYTDRLLGRLLARLERAGLYDDALVVLLADHGVSFKPGEGRRPVTGENLADIANIPLFVKTPGQRRAAVDQRAAQTIDVVPTIADVLDVRIPWEVDGRSLLGTPPVGRGILVDRRGGRVRGTVEQLTRDRAAVLREKARHFGEGNDSLYRIGTNRSLLGRHVDGLPRQSTEIGARIEHSDQLGDVRRASGYVPAQISGTVRTGSVEPTDELAVAVNGRIRALTRVFTEDGRQRIRAIVPEWALHDGANEVELFLIRGSSTRPSLAPIGST